MMKVLHNEVDEQVHGGVVQGGGVPEEAGGHLLRELELLQFSLEIMCFFVLIHVPFVVEICYEC